MKRWVGGSTAGIKIAGRNINNLRYADDTTLMAESEEELKSLLMKVKEESKNVGLKLNIQKTKIMASGPITSWEIDGETVETVTDFIFLGSKMTADGDYSHEIKRHLLLGRSYDQPRAAISGVAQSQTRLKRLSSSSSMIRELGLCDSLPLKCFKVCFMDQHTGYFEKFSVCFCTRSLLLSQVVWCSGTQSCLNLQPHGL